jgi:hypothetical protein
VSESSVEKGTYDSMYSLFSILHRWHNHLDPSINKNPWTVEEDAKILEAHTLYGNKWADIAKLIPGRYLTLHDD